MYPIVKKEKLADKIYLMDVKAPRVAQYCEPGQFVIVKIDEQGERIPLTIGGSFHTAHGILGAGGCVRRFRGTAWMSF